jgi:hypothetical protein
MKDQTAERAPLARGGHHPRLAEWGNPPRARYAPKGIVSVEMDQPLQKAYEDMEQDIKKALREHRGNQSVASVALNALLA